MENNKTVEFLFIQQKDLPLPNGQTLEDALIEKAAGNDQLIDLIRSVETNIPNLVLKIPDWTNVIFENMQIDDVEVTIKAGIRQQFVPVGLRVSNVSNVFEDVPIQIKESEKLIPVENGTTTTIWEDEIDDHFPSLSKCPINILDYSVYENDDYQFIDKMSINDDLVNGRVCSIRLTDDNGGQNQDECTKVYGRDCDHEKNVIEGFKLANNSVFTGINNQPGGEDVLSLHYVFVASQMCGDPTVPMDCPPTSWKFVFFGTVNDFYDIQFHWGYPESHEFPDVILYGNGYYIKSFPRYYDIPVDHSFENIYSQAPYLINTANSTWDGNIYGSVVSFSVYEHDDVIVKETNSQSISVTNTTKISSKLSLGGIFEGGGDFSSTVTRTSTYTYMIEAEKDVEMGQNASVYFDANRQSPGFYGINKSTGSIITHFAYYQ